MVPPREVESSLGGSTVLLGSRIGRSCCAGLCLALGIFISALASPAAQADQLVLRIKLGTSDQVVSRHGLTLISRLTAANDRLVLVDVGPSRSAESVASWIVQDSDVLSAESDASVSLPVLSSMQLVSSVPPEELEALRQMQGTGATPCQSSFLPYEPWAGFSLQRASERISLSAAHAVSPDCGATTVAILDTGVDPDHELLQGALVEGYDFIEQQAGIPSEWNNLDHSVQAILEDTLKARADHSVQAILEGGGDTLPLESSFGPLIDPQLAMEWEDTELPAFFGHGTMVAGIVRLVAPAARIMPLKVFNADGEGSLFDILAAIYYAVDHGARVINMSFSMDRQTQELRQALQYARSRGVVCVAAAGNRGTHSQVFPAAYSSVLGVASTTGTDGLSEFSNFGSGFIALAAPGSAIVSLYPGGHFAAGWGTSFSAPFVSGAVALIHNLVPYRAAPDGQSAQIQVVRNGADWLQELAGDIGAGRLNTYQSLLQAAQ
jgi:subtilisin family serine protease